MKKILMEKTKKNIFFIIFLYIKYDQQLLTKTR